MENTYDLIVIGGGPGGYVAAIRAAQQGLKTALVEARQVGGTCLNRGCIPTKTLMHTAQLYGELTHCEGLGIDISAASVNTERLYARKDDVVRQLREGVEFLLKANGVHTILGRATIQKAGSVTVATAEGELALGCKNILIATGSVPATPPIPGLQLPGVITSDELLAGGKAFESLVIIGGGVIGVEFATIFSALGCKVTIIEALERILPTMDREISQNLSMILKKRGIDIFAGGTVEKLEQDDTGLSCHFAHKGAPQTVPAQAVLVAIGRRPNTQGLLAPGLELAYDRGIVVDKQFATSVPGIWAIGDVISGGIQLAHMASAQAGCAVAAMQGRQSDINLAVVPACIYTNPEIASVGITADEAKAAGMAVKTGKFAMSANGKTIIEALDRGFIKVVFDAESQVLLGAQLMCGRATDLVGELATAIANRLTLHQLAAVIHPHPTFCEGIAEAVEDAAGAAVHIAPKRK